MANAWQSGLDDDDSLSGYPSAANPLTAMGLDPDEVRANPDMLARLSAGAAKGPKANASEYPPPTTTSGPPAAPPPTLASQGQEGVTGELRTAKQEEDDAKSLGTVDPSIMSAQSARDQARTAAEGFNDAPYQPSTGQKIWRGVRGALVGLGTGRGAIKGAIDPGEVGSTPYDAPNAAGQAERDKLLRGQKSTQESYDEALDNWKRAQEARKEGAGATDKAGTMYGGAAGHATGLMNAENKPETEANKDAEKLQLTQKEFEQRQQQLKSPELAKLSPMNKMLYMANGKVPDPREPTEGEITAQQIQRAMVTLGHPPRSLEEFNQVVAAAKGELGKGKGSQPTIQQQVSVADKKKAAIQKAQAEYAKDPGSKESLQQYQSDLQEAQNAYEEESGLLAGGGDLGQHQVVTVDKDGQVTWTPQAATAPTQATQPTAPAASAQKPQPAPDGTRKRAADGTIKVKQNGKWVTEGQ